jgi:cobalamin-dependent methionine synthase I
MIIIAENLNTRNQTYVEALKKNDRKAISRMAKELVAAGAAVINVQCSLDGSGDEDTLPLVVGAISEETEAGLCLDSRNFIAIKKSLPLCKRPPLINFISATEPEQIEELLDLTAGSRSSLVLRASKGIVPTTLEAKLQIIEELIEMANEADIPNERLFADPSIVHIGRGMGQDHVVNSCECVRLLKEMVEPPINTIAWISNISTALPRALKGRLNSTFLSYMAGAGLNAALVDVLDPEIRKTVYLIRSFRDEIVFSPADLSG